MKRFIFLIIPFMFLIACSNDGDGQDGLSGKYLPSADSSLKLELELQKIGGSPELGHYEISLKRNSELSVAGNSSS